MGVAHSRHFICVVIRAIALLRRSFAPLTFTFTHSHICPLRSLIFAFVILCVREGILLSSFSQSNRNPAPAKRIVGLDCFPFNFKVEEPSKSLPQQFCLCVCMYVCVFHRFCARAHHCARTCYLKGPRWHGDLKSVSFFQIGPHRHPQRVF